MGATDPPLVTIRRYHPSDAEALWFVYYSAVRDVASKDYSHAQISAWAPESFDPALWAARLGELAPFVAERAGALVGYADVQPDGYIDHFFVAGGATRQGIGSRLMERIHEQAADAGLTRLYAHVSITARPFFEHWGFGVERQQTLDVGGVSLTNFRMTKALSPAMDASLRQQMLAYYDERAPEYEEAYTRGTGTASITDPQVFTLDAATLEGIVARVARGRLLDLACGTAYWLPHYAAHCSHVTLFDQSPRMLAEAQAKASRLGMLDRCRLVRGDFFEHDLPLHAYDTVLVGFFLSHLTTEEEPLLFGALNQLLSSTGRFLILDSAWSAERAAVNNKVERQARQLNDGTRFEIFKRYLDPDDVARWAHSYAVTLSVEHFGRAFCAISGSFAAPGHSTP